MALWASSAVLNCSDQKEADRWLFPDPRVHSFAPVWKLWPQSQTRVCGGFQILQRGHCLGWPSLPGTDESTVSVGMDERIGGQASRILRWARGKPRRGRKCPRRARVRPSIVKPGDRGVVGQQGVSMRQRDESPASPRRLSSRRAARRRIAENACVYWCRRRESNPHGG